MPKSFIFTLRIAEENQKVLHYFVVFLFRENKCQISPI